MLRYLTILLVLITCQASAQFEFNTELTSPAYLNRFYLEPSFSHATYETNQIKQKGYLYGISAGYDFLAYNNPYCGFQANYRSGRLKTKDLSSDYTDYLFEAKLGYTLGSYQSFAVIPYVGVGYENEENDYKATPIDKLSYYYFSVGLISEAFFSPYFSLGCNIKTKYPFSGNQKIKNETIDVKVSVSKKVQYNVEVPMTYWASNQLSLSVVPFYEYKNYNNSSVSIETNSKAKMHQWGLGMKLNFCF